jgi:purine-cytosine permease-like protein
MEKSRGGVFRSFVAIIGPAIPVIIGVVLTLLLTISPRDASKNFTAWEDAFSGLRQTVSAPGAALHQAATAKAWFNPGVIVVLFGIAVSLATGFMSAWLQLRETRKRAAAMIEGVIDGELLAKLTAPPPGSGGQAD